jgi:hypothetical protein
MQRAAPASKFSGAAGTHVPPAQPVPLAHLVAQLPQWSLSLFGSMHAPPQASRPGRHPDEQAFAEHTREPVHLFPQSPQLFGSVLVAMHPPPHRVWYVGQTQTPFEQTWPGPHDEHAVPLSGALPSLVPPRPSRWDPPSSTKIEPVSAAESAPHRRIGSARVASELRSTVVARASASCKRRACSEQRHGHQGAKDEVQACPAHGRPLLTALCARSPRHATWRWSRTHDPQGRTLRTTAGDIIDAAL